MGDEQNPSDNGSAALRISAGDCRQVATLLFCDLCDSTRLASEIDAEDYGELLTLLRAELQSVVTRHGGEVGQFYGDGALVLFAEGAARPEPAIDAALAAALSLHEHVRAMQPVNGIRLALHSGVHAGLVLMREGDAAKGRFEAVGLATAVAARLAAAALPDEILVSDATLGPARWRYAVGVPRKIVIDRAGDRLLAVPVTGRVQSGTRPASARTGDGLSPYVGRRRELAQVERMLADALGGHASAVAFAAPPGQGKSRFAAEVARRGRAMGYAILAGASEPRGEPLQPFRQMVRSIADPAMTPEVITEADLQQALAEPGMAALVKGAAAEKTAAEKAAAADPGALAAAVRVQIERLAEQVPVLLLLDDWQWADTASVQLLKSLVVVNGRLAILLLERPPEPGTLPLDAVAHLPLPPLDEADGLELIQARVPALDSVVAARIHRAAGGNPLFIEELCHLADEGGLEMPDVSGAGWFAASIEARYRRLPPRLATLVRTAAVMGMTLSEALLAEIAGVPIDAADKAELERLDLLFATGQPGMLRFKHGLARDILNQLVASADRRALHAQIAAALAEREPDAHEALAIHYAESRQPALAADHAEKAGNAAAAAAAIDRAQIYYRMALDALDRLPPSAEVLGRWAAIVRRFATIAIYDSDVSHIALFEEACRRARLVGDQVAIAQTEYWLGFSHATTGSSRLALPHFRQALETTTRLGADAMAAEIRATLGHALSAMCAYSEALPMLDEGTRLKAKNGRPSLNAPPSLAFKAALLGDQGQFDDAYGCLDAALAMIAGSGHQVEGTVQSWYTQILLWQGRLEEALEHANRDREVTELTENAYMNALARNFLASARFMIAPSSEERSNMEATARCLELRRKQLYISLCHGRCADAAAADGDVAAVRFAAARALQRGRTGDLLGAAMAWRALARVAQTRVRAEHCLRQAHAVADRRNSPHERGVTLLAEAKTALRFKSPSAAHAPLDKAQEIFTSLAMPWFQGQAAALREQL